MAKSGPGQFFKEVKQETRKVTWPVRKEVTITTVIVFIMVTIVSLFLMLADTVISATIQFMLGL